MTNPSEHNENVNPDVTPSRLTQEGQPQIANLDTPLVSGEDNSESVLEEITPETVAEQLITDPANDADELALFSMSIFGSEEVAEAPRSVEDASNVWMPAQQPEATPLSSPADHPTFPGVAVSSPESVEANRSQSWGDGTHAAADLTEDLSDLTVTDDPIPFDLEFEVQKGQATASESQEIWGDLPDTSADLMADLATDFSALGEDPNSIHSAWDSDTGVMPPGVPEESQIWGDAAAPPVDLTSERSGLAEPFQEDISQLFIPTSDAPPTAEVVEQLFPAAADEIPVFKNSRRTPRPKTGTLRQKAVLLAIAIGVLPVIGIGATEYIRSSRELKTNITQAQEAKVAFLSEAISRFMAERYGDIQVLATLPFLSDPSLSQTLPRAEKVKTLKQYMDSYGIYESVTAVDLQGNILVRAGQEDLSNYQQLEEFKQVIQSKQPVITPIQPIGDTDQYALYTAAPIFSSQDGTLLGMVRASIRVETLDKLYLRDNLALQDVDYHLVDSQGQTIAAREPEDIGGSASDELPDFESIRQAQDITTLQTVDQRDKKTQIASYAPIATIQGAGATSPDAVRLNWSLILAQDTNLAFASLQAKLGALTLSTLLTAILVGAVATLLARRLVQPLLVATNAVREIGQGNFNVRLDASGNDELAQLSQNINRMAEQIQVAQLSEVEAVRQRVEAQEAATRQQTELAEQQLAAQIKVSEQQAEFAEEQRRQKEAIQMQLINLLSSIDGAAQGDLTVRAEVSADEIGVVADFFNSIIESLRQIVTQVKLSVHRVNESVGDDESAMQGLAEEAIEQASEIGASLDSIQKMTLSIRDVAKNAKEAALVAQSASRVATLGRDDMDRVVDNIMTLQGTVQNAAAKVRQLGEASEGISKVLTQINQIALQTDLLAINAEIEAARSGAAGQRFAVVAREVSALAARSAGATEDIEKIILEIQRATQEVAEAMETGTTEVEVGTELVAKTKARLERILSVSSQIDQLVQSISSATDSQSKTSQVVTQLIKQVAVSSQQTAESSRKVSEGLQRTAEIAAELQYSVRSFKVSDDS